MKRRKGINKNAQDLLLAVGVETNAERRPVEITLISRKYGRHNNDSSIYARIDILEREGYLSKIKNEGDNTKVLLTLKGWRFLSSNYGLEISAEGIVGNIRDIEEKTKEKVKQEVTTNDFVYEVIISRGLEKEKFLTKKDFHTVVKILMKKKNFKEITGFEFKSCPLF